MKEENVLEFVKTFVLANLFGLLYFTGLTALLVFFLTKNLPKKVLFFSANNYDLLLIAAVLALVGFFAVFIVLKDQKRSYRKLGVITLVPAAIALFFSVFGKATILSLLEKHLFEFKKLEPYFIQYLDRTVPSIEILTAGYLFFGLLFLYFGFKKEK